jgi:hypothetical protein
LLICARADVLLCTAVFVVAGCRQADTVTSISGTVTHTSEAVVPGTRVIVRKGGAEPRTAPTDQQFKETHVAVQVQSSLQLDLKLIGEVYGC